MDIKYELLKRPFRKLHLKVSVFDRYFELLEDLTFVLLSGDTSVNANSDLRRTFNVELTVTKDSLKPLPRSNIWLDRYLQFFVGIEDYKNNNQIVWYNQGFGVIDSPSWKYDAKTNTLSFSAIDLVSELNGERGGCLPGLPVEIASGENVKEAIIATLQEFANLPLDRMEISECYNRTREYIQSVPYDMTFEQGSTIWDILIKLRDILPNYEMYFDENGVFHYKEIPYKSNPEIVIFDDLWKETVLSENTELTFRDVYNYIEVYGSTQDLTEKNGFAGEANYLDVGIAPYEDVAGVTKYVKAYFVNVPAWPDSAVEQEEGIEQGTLNSFTFDYKDSYEVLQQPFIRVNSGDALPIKTYIESGPIGYSRQIPFQNKNRTYLIGVEANNIINFGAIQHYGEAKDENPNSPFNIYGEMGIVRKVCYGGDYSNIYSDELCRQRAEWELYQSCRVPDTISINTVANYIVQPNTVVQYTSNQTKQTNLYLIQSYNTSWGHAGTSTIVLQRYFPYYKDS